MEFLYLIKNLRCLQAEEIKNRLVIFGKKFREIRLSKNLTQEDIAFQSGISYNQIGRIERGEINTSLGNIFVLAETLNIPVSGFFDN